MKKKNNIRDKIKNFYKRWNIKYDEEKRIEDFKNRVLSTIDMILPLILAKKRNLSLLKNYLKYIGVYIQNNKLFRYPENVFRETFELKIKHASLKEIMFYLQCLFDLGIDENIKHKLYESIKEDIDLSLIDVKIKKTKSNHYILYPAGAKLLDEGVVNDVLDWLSDYPDSYKNFKDALTQYEEHKYTRNIIDNLRFSLESLLRNILHNRKNLENQKELLGKYLKKKGVSKEVREMFRQQISYYSKYQNEHAKHNDSIQKSEIEFMIYLTGTFMRFILTLEINPKSS